MHSGLAEAMPGLAAAEAVAALEMLLAALMEVGPDGDGARGRAVLPSREKFQDVDEAHVASMCWKRTRMLTCSIAPARF